MTLWLNRKQRWKKRQSHVKEEDAVSLGALWQLRIPQPVCGSWSLLRAGRSERLCRGSGLGVWAGTGARRSLSPSCHCTRQGRPRALPLRLTQVKARKGRQGKERSPALHVPAAPCSAPLPPAPGQGERSVGVRRLRTPSAGAHVTRGDRTRPPATAHGVGIPVLPFSSPPCRTDLSPSTRGKREHR